MDSEEREEELVILFNATSEKSRLWEEKVKLEAEIATLKKQLKNDNLEGGGIIK